MSYLLGLDASYAQGSNIDYAQAKAAGYEFWLQRVSYAYPGQGCKLDTTGNANYYGAQKVGFIVGGYHKVGWTDPVAEADFFCKAMQPYAEGDLFAYDKEPSSDAPIPANWADWEQQFVQRVIDNTGGVKPFDYSNISMFNAMPRQGVVADCGPWIAAPSFSFDAALPVNASVVMQQGPTTQVPGIPENVTDTDAFFGTREELLAYGYHAPQAAPAPTPAPAQPPVPVVPETPVAPAPEVPAVPAPVPTDPASIPATPVTPVVVTTPQPKSKSVIAAILVALAAVVAYLLAVLHK